MSAASTPAAASTGAVDRRPPELERLDFKLLDCLEVNVAALLELRGAPDLRAPFACEWHFDVEPGQLSPVLERTPLASRLAATTAFTLEVRQSTPARVLADCLPLVRSGQRVLVRGDAMSMDWLPYFGRESMDHSLVLESVDPDGRRLQVLDAYDNVTEWGEASPVRLQVDASLVERAVGSLGTPFAGWWATLEPKPTAPRFDAFQVLRANAEAMASHAGRIARFRDTAFEARGDGEAMKRFSLACWLVHRARTLHGLWLGDLAAGGWTEGTSFARSFQDEVAGRWKRVNELAYLVYRRARLGKPAPQVVFDVLGELEAVERDHAQRLGAALPR
ncbi:MAG: hypothetical protein K1X89_09980 [Myxococcaceae bacterium]|nr:hypothetical protein [Myxococcaceae bacterium]